MARDEGISTTVLIVIVLTMIFIGGGSMAMMLLYAEMPNLTGGTTQQTDNSFEIYTSALENEDTNLCHQISDIVLKDDCYKNLGVRLGEKDLCGLITNNVMRNFCMINTGNCATVSGVDKDICLQTEAISTQDSSLCENINDTIININCYIDVALAADDSSHCNALEEAEKELCLSVYAQDSGGIV